MRFELKRTQLNLKINHTQASKLPPKALSIGPIGRHMPINI